MSYEEFLAKLHPKVAAEIRTAEQTSVERLPLASYGLTRDLGGGIARGRVSLIYGATSAGKSLLVQQSIAKWQEQGLVCGYVDVEGTWDKAWASRIGVNNEELIMEEARSSGKIEEKITPLLQAGIDVLVIDSISDILSEVFVDKSGEMNGQSDRKQIGSQAKAITALINGIHYLNKNTAVILISQTTTFFGQSYVEQVPHGGQKVLFASSQVIRLVSSASPNSQIKDKILVGDTLMERPVGREVEYLVKKNKLGAPFGSGKYNLYYDGPKVGIDTAQEILSDAVKLGIITKSGSWFSYGEQKWQGLDSAVKYFGDNPEKFRRVEEEIHLRRTGEVL